MANGLSVGPLTGQVSAPTVGLAAGFQQGTQAMTALLKELAFERLRAQRAEDKFARQAQLQRDLQAEQIRALGERQQAQQAFQKELEAQRQKFQKELAKIQKEKPEDPFDVLFKGSVISERFGLDFKDPEVSQAIKDKDVGDITSLAAQTENIKKNILPELGRSGKLGRFLSFKDRKKALELAQRASTRPSDIPRLMQFVEQAREQRGLAAAAPRTPFFGTIGEALTTPSPEAVSIIEAIRNLFGNTAIAGPPPAGTPRSPFF